VRMSVVELGNDLFERIEHVQISARIEIGSGQCSSRMENHQMTRACVPSMMLLQERVDLVRDVNNLALAVRLDRKTMHEPRF
jgi:hypothetical protein